MFLGVVLLSLLREFEKSSLIAGIPALIWILAFQQKRIYLLVINEVEPFLVLEIIRGELIFCDDFDAQGEYEFFVLRRAGDLAYYKKQHRRQILFGNH